MDAYIRAVTFLSRVAGVFAALLIALAVLVICDTVVERYILNLTTIWQIDAEGLRQVSYQASDNYQLMADFLANPEQYLRYLFSGGTG